MKKLKKLVLIVIAAVAVCCAAAITCSAADEPAPIQRAEFCNYYTSYAAGKGDCYLALTLSNDYRSFNYNRFSREALSFTCEFKDTDGNIIMEHAYSDNDNDSSRELRYFMSGKMYLLYNGDCSEVASVSLFFPEGCFSKGESDEDLPAFSATISISEDGEPFFFYHGIDMYEMDETYEVAICVPVGYDKAITFSSESHSRRNPDKEAFTHEGCVVTSRRDGVGYLYLMVDGEIVDEFYISVGYGMDGGGIGAFGKRLLDSYNDLITEMNAALAMLGLGGFVCVYFALMPISATAYILALIPSMFF